MVSWFCVSLVAITPSWRFMPWYRVSAEYSAFSPLSCLHQKRPACWASLVPLIVTS